MSVPPGPVATGAPSGEVRDVLRRLGGRLPIAEARLLLAHVTAVPVTRLLTHPPLDDAALEEFEALVRRRLDGIPLQYLTGVAPFRHVEVAVGPGVFIPRPETEAMTGWALEQLAELGERPVVVELCAGSGAISLAIADECGVADQYAVELSETAVEFARRNLIGTGVTLVQGDMAEAFAELDGTVDLVIANPPYVPLEAYDGIRPRSASTSRHWRCSPARTAWTRCGWSPGWPPGCCAPAAGCAPSTPRCSTSRRRGCSSTTVASTGSATTPTSTGVRGS